MSNVSKRALDGFKRGVATLTMTATVLSLSGFAVLSGPMAALAAVPGDYGLQEGNTISAAGSSDPDIYIVNAQGYKRLFLNPVIFNFYGHLGGFPNVKNVSSTARDAFPTSGLFQNCETGDPKVYGVETTGEDTGMLHWVNTSGSQAVADDPNFFKKVFCINNNEFAWYSKGADYTSVNQVPNYVRGTTPTSTGPMSASLAADNPASTTLLETQATAHLASFNVSGSGLVTKVSLKRLGIAGDTTLSNVFLFVNGARVSDGFTFSNNVLTFNDANGFFTAPAVVQVKADIADNVSGQVLGIQLTEVNTSTVSVSGNLHTIASNPSDLATVALSSLSGGGSLDPQKDVTVWQVSANVTGNDSWFQRLSLREIGSVNYADINNFRLFVDGVQVATSAGLNSNGYVTFLMNQKMLTGNRTVKVVADIVGGASRTYSFSLKGAYDFSIVDGDYNVGVSPTGSFPLTTSSGTIGAASVTAIKASNTPSGDIVDEATDVPFASYTLTAYGEAVKLDTLSFRASVSDAGISGLSGSRVLINGTQYGSTQNLSATASTSYTVNYTLQPGVATTVELRADAKEQSSGTDVSVDDVISILFESISTSNNAQGVTSGNILDVPSSGRIESNNRTIVVGAMALAKAANYSNQTIVLPQSAYKIGEWNLTGANSEATNLNTLSLDVDAVTGATFDKDDLRDLYIVYGGSQTTVKSTVTAADNDFSISRTLNANEVLNIKAYATLLSGNVTSGNSFKTDLTVTGTTAGSGAADSEADVDGQTVTFGAASFTSERDTSMDSTLGARRVADEQTVTAAAFKFTSINETFKLSRLNFTMPNATGINMVHVYDGDGTTLVQSLPPATDLTFNIPQANQPVVTGGTSKTLLVKLELGTIASPGGGDSGANHTVTLVNTASRKIANSSGVEDALTGSNPVGNVLYAYKAVPVITRTALTSSLVAGGATNTLAKFNIGSGGTGTVGWIKFILDFSKSANVGITDIAVYDANNESVALAGGITSTSTQITFVATNEQPAGDYVVKAQIPGTTGGTDFVTLNWNSSGLGFVAPVASGSVGATSSFVWTDQSDTPHNESALDWNNDYLIKNLSLDSWSLQD